MSYGIMPEPSTAVTKPGSVGTHGNPSGLFETQQKNSSSYGVGPGYLGNYDTDISRIWSDSGGSGQGRNIERHKFDKAPGGSAGGSAGAPVRLNAFTTMDSTDQEFNEFQMQESFQATSQAKFKFDHLVEQNGFSQIHHQSSHQPQLRPVHHANTTTMRRTATPAQPAQQAIINATRSVVTQANAIITFPQEKVTHFSTFSNNNYQIQRINKQPFNQHQPLIKIIQAKPNHSIQQVTTPAMVTNQRFPQPIQQAFQVQNGFSNQPCLPPRRNRSIQQTNLHYALSDCQEQFNDLKSELKLRKHCERDNLKTEELCYQFESTVLPDLMSKLERCEEKHWSHIEADIIHKIDNCKNARNKEKKLSTTFGTGQRCLDMATEVVTQALVDLTRCLRICRTLLWASQVPLKEYPPRLGYNNNDDSRYQQSSPVRHH